MTPRDKLIIRIALPLGLLLGALSFPVAPPQWGYLGIVALTTVIAGVFGRAYQTEEKSAKAIVLVLIIHVGFVLSRRILGLPAHREFNMETAVQAGQFISTVSLTLCAVIALIKARRQPDEPWPGEPPPVR